MSDFMRDVEEPDILRHPPTTCPHCGFQANAATRVLGYTWSPPEDGDWSLCLGGCGQPSRYEIGPLGIRLAKPDPAELAEFLADEEGQTAMARSEAWRRSQGRI